jgi:hypothetical protein
MTNTSDKDLLDELVRSVRQSGVTVRDEDLAVVLPIFGENREGLMKLRRALAEAEEPAVIFSNLVAGTGDDRR